MNPGELGYFVPAPTATATATPATNPDVSESGLVGAAAGFGSDTVSTQSYTGGTVAGGAPLPPKSDATFWDEYKYPIIVLGIVIGAITFYRMKK